MSRILKFRVFDTVLNRFVAFHYTCFEDKELVLQQFIGLFDRNKKEIYEGDIIKFDISGFPHGPEREIGLIGEVHFNSTLCCWCFGKDEYSFFDRIDKKSLEVIGNIFENSELLKT